MKLYIYTSGIALVVLVSFALLYWLEKVRTRIKLMKLSLTLIPYEVLMEPKTVSAIKGLNHIWII